MGKNIQKIIFVFSMLVCVPLCFVMAQQDAEENTITAPADTEESTITTASDIEANKDLTADELKETSALKANIDFTNGLDPAVKPAINAYREQQTALVNRDYKTAWNRCCLSFQQNAWENSFEKYEQYYYQPPNPSVGPPKNMLPEESQVSLLPDKTSLEEMPFTNELKRFIKDAKLISPSEVQVKVAIGQTFVMAYEDGEWCNKGTLDYLLEANGDAVKAYKEHQAALLERDYKTAWSQCCKSYQQGKWENSFEKFEQWHATDLEELRELRRFINDVKIISPSEVRVKVATPQTFAMSYEDGKWCNKGTLDYLLEPGE